MRHTVFRHPLQFAAVGVVSLLAAAPLRADPKPSPAVPPIVTNLWQFHQLGGHQQRITCVAHLTGVVAWADRGGNRFILQDDFAGEFVELPPSTTVFKAGQRVMVEGLCSGGGGGQ